MHEPLCTTHPQNLLHTILVANVDKIGNTFSSVGQDLIISNGSEFLIEWIGG